MQKLYSHAPTLFLQELHMGEESRDTADRTATGYYMDRGVRIPIPVVARIFFSPQHPHLFWGSSSLLSNGTGGEAAEACSWSLTSI
jgi:hypothetical protein